MIDEYTAVGVMDYSLVPAWVLNDLTTKAVEEQLDALAKSFIVLVCAFECRFFSS